MARCVVASPRSVVRTAGRPTVLVLLRIINNCSYFLWYVFSREVQCSHNDHETNNYKNSGGSIIKYINTTLQFIVSTKTSLTSKVKHIEVKQCILNKNKPKYKNAWNTVTKIITNN